MSKFVTVAVPARLHLGFLDLGGHSGRRFGSLGLPLAAPETVVTLSHAPVTSVTGPEAGRAARHLETMARHLGIPGHHRLTVEQAIPAHVGLGSGTQIAVAVAAALRTLYRLPTSAAEDAALLGRGSRSGIGIAAFAEGGLIVDAGRRDEHDAPPVVARIGFPEDWRVILIGDGRVEGIHGAEEIEAFRRLPRFPQAATDEICRHVLMGVLAGLADRDIAAFGAAITRIQDLVGAHFSAVQGGVFTSPGVAAAAAALRAAGATGIGQSSWGPTGFAFAASESAARAMVRAAAGMVPDGVSLDIVAGRNAGATIRTSSLGLVGS